MRRARDALRRALLWCADRLAQNGRHAFHSRDRVYLAIEQPPSSIDAPRWGHGRAPQADLAALLTRHHREFMDALALIEHYGRDLTKIDRSGGGSAGEPTWANEFFTGIDAASLYAFVRDRQPQRYLEVGSGHSTRFAARAKRDGDTDTVIISVDPEPRSDIDSLCDEVIRARLEEADLTPFKELESGDIVLFDGSHRVFMNNDVTTFFLDILPRLEPGVLIGVHDITLPEDYFADNATKYWTEQYMLAMALLAAGPERISPVLACHYVCVTPDLKQQLDTMWEGIGFAGSNAYGSTFWFTSSIAQS